MGIVGSGRASDAVPGRSIGDQSCRNDGLAWGAGGLLYVSGHDLAEIYVLRLPKSGDVLEHVATIASPIEGQAIALDPADPRLMYGISRKKREVIATRLPGFRSRAGDASISPPASVCANPRIR